MTRLTFAIALLFVGVVTLNMSAVQPAGEPVFTAAQAAAGQSSYQANCASCHLTDLAGQNEAPPLRGPNFLRTWRERTTRDLVDYMAATMPPGRPSLAEQDYLNLAAFILRSNGAAAGAEALRPSTAVAIG
jgi:mono/diheme cytochrome c family protein